MIITYKAVKLPEGHLYANILFTYRDESEYQFRHFCGEQGMASLDGDKIRIPRYSASEKNHLL
jgi:hypothetical protein